MGNASSWFEGPQGPRGYNGSNGAPGSNGRDGRNGRDGTNGSNGAQGPPGSNGRDGRDGTNGRDGRDGIQGPQGPQGPAGPPSLPIPLGTETVTLEATGASVYNNNMATFTGQNQSVYSQEQYNSSANNTYLQFNIQDLLTSNLSDNIIAGLANDNNDLVYAFRFTYNSDNSTNYTVINNNSLTATYSIPTTFSIYIINNQLTYLVNGLVFYSETIDPAMSLKIYMTSAIQSGPVRLNNIKFYQVARITSIVFSTYDFLEQAEGPLMGLLASVGVNYATYNTYFNDPANSIVKNRLLNDISNWQISNSPLTREKITKFNQYYTCWTKTNTTLITTNLPFCTNYVIPSYTPSPTTWGAANPIDDRSGINLSSGANTAWNTITQGQSDFAMTVINNLNGYLSGQNITPDNVQAYSTANQTQFSDFIIYCINWMNTNAPLTTDKQTAALDAAKLWIQENTTLIPTPPIGQENFRNYTFKGVLPKSRLLEGDYHPYD